jgi:hypothetical protein
MIVLTEDMRANFPALSQEFAGVVYSIALDWAITMIE